MWRLIRGLEAIGHECAILTANPSHEDPRIIRPNRRNVRRRKSSLCSRILNTATSSMCPMPSRGYTDAVKHLNPDVIHFHWTHGPYCVPLNAMVAMSRLKPCIWTIHDMWPITGGCFYAYDCDKFVEGCNRCFQAKSRLLPDTSSFVWKAKRHYYKKIQNIEIVTPSRWLRKEILASDVITKDVVCIPYGVDTSLFCPIEKKTARESLQLRQNDTVFLVIFKSGQRKGFDLFADAISTYVKNHHNENENIVLLIAGNDAHKYSSYNLPKELSPIPIGLVQNERLLCLLYSASDAFLMPTRADNLPSTILESMACGTPVVSFDVGGVGEMVETSKTGYLAANSDPADFAKGIHEIVRDDNLRSALSAQCRAKSLEQYSIPKQAAAYQELYQSAVAAF